MCISSLMNTVIACSHNSGASEHPEYQGIILPERNADFDKQQKCFLKSDQT